MARITGSEVPTQSLWKSTSAMRGMSADRVAAKAMVASAVSPEEAGDGGVGHRAPARAAPPVALGVGGDVGGEALAVVLVEELDRDLVGVAVGGLHLVGVEARGEEQHLLAAGGLQHLVDVGGDAAARG